MAEQIALYERINGTDTPCHADPDQKTCMDRQQG